MELGERIAVLREEQALTQADLAEVARISPSTLSQIESGRVPRPHVGTVRKIARALGVEPAELRRAKEPAVPLADATQSGDVVPNSLGELLERQGANTRHLANENLAATLAQRPLEEVLQMLREISEELEAIGPVLTRLARLRSNSEAIHLFTEASRQSWIARLALPARQGTKFVPVWPEPSPGLEEEIDETARKFEESWATAGMAV